MATAEDRRLSCARAKERDNDQRNEDKGQCGPTYAIPLPYDGGPMLRPSSGVFKTYAGKRGSSRIASKSESLCAQSFVLGSCSTASMRCRIASSLRPASDS